MQQHISRYLPILAILLAAFLFVETLGAIKGYRYIGGEGMPSNVITVSGEGEVFAVSDIATFSFGAEAVADTTELAQREMGDIVTQALAKLKELGIEEKDVKTSSYNVFPRYEYIQGLCEVGRCTPGRQELIGYEASQHITVKVRDVEQAGTVLGALGSTGVTNMSGLSFTIDDEDGLRREARKQAIDDAETKAKQLADDLGVRLVRIVNFAENGGGMPPMYARMESAASGSSMDAAMPAPDLPRGENRIVSNVSITYEIR